MQVCKQTGGEKEREVKLSAPKPSKRKAKSDLENGCRTTKFRQDDGVFFVFPPRGLWCGQGWKGELYIYWRRMEGDEKEELCTGRVQC